MNVSIKYCAMSPFETKKDRKQEIKDEICHMCNQECVLKTCVPKSNTRWF